MPYNPTDNDITYFAKANFRNRETTFGIRRDDRRRHMYILGKTGTGKSTLLENLALSDIKNNEGIAFFDPHGEAVERLLDYIPSNRVNDVVYVNPHDAAYPLGFNVFEIKDQAQKHLVASGLMSVFTKLWANVWSARMEYILQNTVLALLDTPGQTLLGIPRMYTEKKYRNKIVASIKDPVVRNFWEVEYANYTDRYIAEAVPAIQNKVGQFLSSSIIRNIVAQPRSTLDFREIMDNGKILLVNLSKGKIGEDNSALLGAMMITKLQLAAMSRVDVSESKRRDFYLYVDEFQNFATESFATILSEARKYRLNLIIAHQYIAQLFDPKTRSSPVRDAIFGNVGTMITFRTGADDAEFLEKEFEPVFEMNDLVNLTKYHIYLKLMINGVASSPFSAITMSPIAEHTGNAEKVIKVSRERYTEPKEVVEKKIAKWLNVEYFSDSPPDDSQGLTEEDDEDEPIKNERLLSGPEVTSQQNGKKNELTGLKKMPPKKFENKKKITDGNFKDNPVWNEVVKIQDQKSASDKLLDKLIGKIEPQQPKKTELKPEPDIQKTPPQAKNLVPSAPKKIVPEQKTPASGSNKDPLPSPTLKAGEHVKFGWQDMGQEK